MSGQELEEGKVGREGLMDGGTNHKNLRRGQPASNSPLRVSLAMMRNAALGTPSPQSECCLWLVREAA